jgi:hypothetical protein
MAGNLIAFLGSFKAGRPFRCCGLVKMAAIASETRRWRENAAESASSGRRRSGAAIDAS